MDLCPALISVAHDLSPEVEFRTGSMLDLDADDGVWAGIAAFYSLIHFDPADEIGQALREFHRVLRPGGLLLLPFHVGDETLYVDELLGQRVALDFHFLRTGGVVAWLDAAGFLVDARVQRRPYSAEEQTERAYLLARKPRG